jgi:HTH-type transcriptional regulator/antitoxin HigA
MTISTSSRIWSDEATHPGELLGEELDARDLDVAVFSLEIGQSPDDLRAVIAGNRPITAALALALETALEVEATFWMNLQSAYDLTLARIARHEATALPQ